MNDVLSEARRLIKEVLESSDKPLSPKEIAKKSGLSEQTVRAYVRQLEQAGEISRVAYGKYTSVDKAESAKESAAAADTSDEDVLLVPLVTARAEAGRGELILDTGVESFIAYGKASLRSEIGFLPHRLVALRVTGDSMTPTLVPGDIAIVALDDVELIQGGVYVLRFHDVLMIKRLREANGQKLVLTSDNGAYPPLVFRRDEASQLDIQIVGRVVKVEKFI